MKTVANALVVAALVIGLGLASGSRASAQVCEDFTGMSSAFPGAYHAAPWNHGVGAGFPPPAYFTFTNNAAAGFYVQAYPSGEESLSVPGSPTNMSIVAYASGVFPTFFSLDILPGAGDAEVIGLDDNGNTIFYQLVPGGTSFEHVVIEGVGSIAEVVILNGDNETWIDDICID